jgi:hypothetical protein
MVARFGGMMVIALLLPACTRDEWLEYDVRAASRSDVARTRQIMREVAAEAGIPRHFGGSYSPSPPIAIYIRGFGPGICLSRPWRDPRLAYAQ